MHRRATPWITCLLALGISAGAWAQNGAQPTDAAQYDGQRQQDADRPGFVMIEERLIFVLADQPQIYMTSALAKMKQDDRIGAAGELRVAADYVEMQKARAEGEAVEALEKRAEKLRNIADKVEQGELTDADKIGKSFAKTNIALAKHHNKLAKKHLEKERFVAAGHDVAAASRSLKQAIAWSGEEPSDELAALIDNADHVAQNLRTEAVGQYLDADAQPAAAREALTDRPDGRAVPAAEQRPGDPRIETTPAQAANIAEHAEDLTQKLGEKIDQFAQRLTPDDRQDRDKGNEAND